MQKYADIAMLNGGAAEARRSFSLAARPRRAGASRVSCLASRESAFGERRETGDERRTSDFRLRTSRATND
jgi:hypothetical protein